MLDEPLGALDLQLRREMQEELKRIQHELGITFVYVTHDQEEAFSMSDAVAVMDRGRIEQVGEPADVYRRPATTFVAEFVGAANHFQGQHGGGGRARPVPCRACRWHPRHVLRALRALFGSV